MKRHINQMTLEELNRAIKEVSDASLVCINTEFVKFKQLCAFENRLKEEARARAEEAGITQLAMKEYNIIGV